MPDTATRTGETWDEISFRCLGDGHYVAEIMALNIDLRHMVRFPYGTRIELPAVKSTTTTSLPPWKRHGQIS